MDEFSILSEKQILQLNREGVIILPNLISENIINEIKADASIWYKKISFNNRISSLIIGSNQWVEHIGLCSLKALQLALDSNLISFLKNYFNSDPSVGSISIQKKVFSEDGIPLHSDLGLGLSMFIYLTEPDEKYGVTEFIKKSHQTKISDHYKTKNKVEDATYIDINKSPFSDKDKLRTYGGVGTVVIFHRSIWHQLPKFSHAGREILMVQYFKKGSPSKDHMIKSSVLKSLSTEQTDVLMRNSSKETLPSLIEFGSNPDALGVYKIPDWKMFYYLLKFKIFSKVKTP
tara:strand:+ start:354 stop:1220 length:867 start_codon:yes stop_codon:yes gene_type:complete